MRTKKVHLLMDVEKCEHIPENVRRSNLKCGINLSFMFLHIDSDEFYFGVQVVSL